MFTISYFPQILKQQSLVFPVFPDTLWHSILLRHKAFFCLVFSGIRKGKSLKIKFVYGEHPLLSELICIFFYTEIQNFILPAAWHCR